MAAGKKKMKTEGVGKKMKKKKGKGEREKGEKRLKNGLKTHLQGLKTSPLPARQGKKIIEMYNIYPYAPVRILNAYGLV